MRRTILLVGNSPLLYFAARELNKDVARGVENNVIWLTGEKYLPDLALNKSWDTSNGKVTLSKGLENIKLVRTQVKSISLAEQRAVTAKAVLDYDLLVVDRLPTYGYEELQAVKKAVTDLLLSVKAAQNQKASTTARIICKGDSAESLELACRLSELIRKDFPSLVRYVGIDSPILANQKVANQFIRENNLYETEARKADLKLTIEAPQSYMELKQMRGLRVGTKGQALVDADLQAKGWPGVFIIDCQNRGWQNLLHMQKATAKRLVSNIKAVMERQTTMPVELSEKATYLSANNAVFVELGSMISDRTRARIISRLEQRLFTGLK